MTLNIAVLTADAVYLASDFRLWNMDEDRLHTDQSAKSVWLEYGDSSAFVTYTGIGQIYGKDVAQYVKEWFLGIDSASHEQIVDRIQVRGQRLLKRVRRGRVWPPHTFLVVGFARGIPTVTMLSNFQSFLTHDLEAPNGELVVSNRRFTGKPTVLTTGSCRHRDIYRQRRMCERIIRSQPSNSVAIRSAMQTLNRVSSKAKGVNAISEQCSIHSMSKTGAGHFTLDAIGPSVHVLTHGIDLAQLVAETSGKQFMGGKYTIAQIVSQAASASMPHAAEVCRPARASLRGDREAFESFVLSHDAKRSSMVHSMGIDGNMYGEITSGSGGGSSPCIWRPDGILTMLPGVGQALGITIDGVIIGNSTASTGEVRACVWIDGIRKILVAGDVDESPAFSFTPSGMIIGSVAVKSPSGGWLPLPAIWKSHDAPVAVWMDNFPWLGRAVDVGQNGSVLVIAIDGDRCFPAALVQGEMFALERLGSGVPFGFIDGRDALVIQLNADGSQLPLRWTPGVDEGRPVEQLPPDWDVHAVSPAGILAGVVERDGFARPWIYRPAVDDAPFILPHYSHHRAQIRRVNDLATVTGAVIGTHGSHAAFWRPVAGA